MWRWFVLIVFLFFFPHQILISDTIKLKNGTVIENAKTEIHNESVIISENGVKKTFSKSSVASIKLKPVKMKQESSTPKKESTTSVRDERIRIAESLQDQFDWEADVGSKPRLALLNFQAGNGVTASELETVTEIIITNLVKTNLFEVVDQQTILKTKQEQNKYNEDCRKEIKDCTIQLGELINANRILTGKITKINSKYFINGYIVDPTQNRIDFAESEIAENLSLLTQASEIFAKKIAGGVLEYYDVEYKSKVTIQNLSYIKKSAMFPGYGQYTHYSQNQLEIQKYKSIILASVTIGLIFHNISQYQNYLEERKMYKESQTYFLLSWNSPLDAISLFNENMRHEKLKQTQIESQTAMTLLAAVYILNLVDAYFLPTRTKSSESDQFFFRFESNSRFPSMHAGSKENLLTAEYGYRF
ncbi:hypothetical protein EHQ58_12405 [Leptospira ognonensis]|uniref:Uncharacterized protein n=1 Tax=Leptospira ognonensis TaxID=2484945 RepID=A0A4R9K229_9LEPT|nr:DUF5683 domain-containing protein [Leptospira ognonensis]TGL58175.1 hypothetical protein EHQ58_12405 [Leptospira ognonensis]